jgi:hypothetical protein
MTTTKRAATKVTQRQTTPPEPERPPVDVRAQCQAWHAAQQHIDTIDAQTGPDAALQAQDAERLRVARAGHVAAQAAAEEALA